MCCYEPQFTLQWRVERSDLEANGRRRHQRRMAGALVYQLSAIGYRLSYA